MLSGKLIRKKIEVKNDKKIKTKCSMRKERGADAKVITQKLFKL